MTTRRMPSRRALLALPALVLARPGQAQEASPAAVFELAARTNALGAQLLAGLDQNADAVAVSPLSLLDAMALLIPGARGRTQAGLAALLGPNPQAAHARLHAGLAQAEALRRAGGAWLPIGEDPLPAYRAALAAMGADLAAVDFADPRTLVRINAWVAERTGGLIPNLLDSLPVNATMVLTAALHFAADWAKPFEARLTAPRRFRPAVGEAVELPFLNDTRHLPYAEGNDIHAVRLGYAVPDFELVLVAPRAERGPSVVRSLVARGGLGAAVAALNFAPASVRLAFPRFQLTSTTELLSGLRRLNPAFTAGADYSGITGHPVVISQVRQKVVMKVDEKGTEAAAATAIVGTRGIVTRQSSFVADAPFWAGLIHVPSGVQIVSALINLPQTG